MAKYDNIDVNGKDAFANKTPSYDSIMKQKAKDTKKALHKQKKEDDMEAAGKAMDEEVAKEAEEKAAVEKQAIENNGSTVETRDKNKALETQEPAATAVEDIKTQASNPETEQPEDFQVGEKVEISEEIPENVKKELDSSDEGKQANAAVEANDPAALQNIVTPDGEAVLKGSYDKDGRYVPKVYSIDEAAKMQNKGWAGVATIISTALSAFGAMLGLPIVPINFYHVLGTDKYLDNLNKMEEDYASVLNTSVTPAATTSNVRKAEQEANISDIEAYKDLEQPDIQKAASVNASVGGQNTQLEVQREAQEWEAKQKELDRDFAKVMNDLNTESQIAILKQQAVNQQDLANLMNDLEIQKIVKKIAYAKEAGLTPDETAKWLKAEQGITQFGAAMGYAGDAAKVAGEVANTFLKSDKDCKKFVYDGKAANSKMFSKVRPKW